MKEVRVELERIIGRERLVQLFQELRHADEVEQPRPEGDVVAKRLHPQLEPYAAQIRAETGQPVSAQLLATILIAAYAFKKAAGADLRDGEPRDPRATHPAPGMYV